MLFNLAWQKKPVEAQPVQPVDDLLSTASLMAWLEKQPASEVYPYENPYRCLLGEYFHAHGDCVVIGQYNMESRRHGTFRIPSAFFDAVTPKPHTYGAALKRLKDFA